MNKMPYQAIQKIVNRSLTCDAKRTTARSASISRKGTEMEILRLAWDSSSDFPGLLIAAVPSAAPKTRSRIGRRKHPPLLFLSFPRYSNLMNSKEVRTTTVLISKNGRSSLLEQPVTEHFQEP